MPQPGWYADPDGTPERLRWWDGTRWTENVHGGSASVQAAGRGRGPWPWVALVSVAGLVVAVGFGLSTGLLGRDGVTGTPGTPEPRPAPASKGTPSAPTLPAVSPKPTAIRTSAPVRTPEPLPTIPSTPPTPADDGCPKASDPASLSDGRLRLSLPNGWTPVDGLAWLSCTRAAASADQAATVSLGLSDMPFADLQDAAEYVWSIALLDAAIPHPLTQTSTPVTVAGMDGWMVSGTIGVRDQPDDLTVVVVDTGGEAPSVVVTLAGTHDATAQAAVQEVLQSLRPA